MIPPKVRCAIYTRKSSEEGLDQDYNSLHAQRDACAAYVASQAGEGWTLLPGEYDDGGFSGGSMERPGLKRLLSDIAAGRIDVVVVYKVDRLTRSLGDFSRIVEAFDAAGASFVSVTQAFNTTTSMGRLTLNMLLSFAQFEREVTGERIRDKIAASKRRGMWMGGPTPLGYDPDGRTLKINEAEANLVRHIFVRYLALGSVAALQTELLRDGHRSKVRCTKSGKQVGGSPFSRGALFHLLANRLYVGEIPHKGEFFPGQHPAIVERDVFDAAQANLLQNAGDKRRVSAGLRPTETTALLTGKIRNDIGVVMSPVVARKPGGVEYRYYVAGAAQPGRSGMACGVRRVPADTIDAIVRDRAEKLALVGPDQTLREVVEQVVVCSDEVRIRFSAAGRRLSSVDVETALAPDTVDVADGHIEVRALVQVRRRAGATVITAPTGETPFNHRKVDPALFKGLVRAEAWKRQLMSGRVATIEAIATQEGVRAAYVLKLLRLAFLDPSLKRAVIEGRAPVGLSVQQIVERGLADQWRDQRAVIASSAVSGEAEGDHSGRRFRRIG